MSLFLRFFQVALLLVLFTTMTNANIIYVDVNPDQTTNINGFNQYDLNNSTTNDLLFNVGTSFGTDFISITRPTIMPGVTSVEVLVYNSSPTIDKLATGEMIGPTSGSYRVGNTNSCSACIRAALPEWSFGAANNVYIGFRFTLDPQGTTHYGWALLDVNLGNSSSSVVVKEFGWENTPNTPIAAGDKGIVPVTSVDIFDPSGNNTITTNGGTLQLDSIVLPANASNPTLAWASFDPTIATVSNTGLVQAVSNGTVQIVAQSRENFNLTDIEVITITNQVTPVTSLSIYGQGGVFNVANNATLQMLKTTTPNTATDSSVTWSVTNGTGAATINPSTGLLSATAVGTVTVRATANDGSGVFDDAVITIDPILVTSLSIYGQGGIFNVANNATLQMLKTTTPNTATDSSVTWSVTNGTGAATINPSTGLLSATAVGTVTVRATANDGSGVFDDAVITIDPILVTNLAIYGQGGVFNVANSATLQMLKTTTPNTATDSSVTWSVTNGTGAATINPSTGLLSATAVGTVTVRATANDGSGIFDDAVITIDPILVTNLSIYGQGGVFNVANNATLQMLKTTTPNTATDSSVTWSVTNGTGAATINPSTGLLSATAVGTVTVRATTNDGSGVFDDAVITIDPILVTNLSIYGQGGVFNVANNATLQMLKTTTPNTATDSSVTWSVTNGTGAATINPSTGLLSATAVGTVTVRATANDGSGVFDDAVITIDPILVTSLSIYGQGGVFNVANNATLQMLKTTTPNTATDSSVTWSVTNGTGAATINPSTGLLSATAVGTVTVRATANDGSGVFDDAVITIDPILVTSLSIYGQGGVFNVANNATLQMLKSTTPTTATDSSVTWSVTNGTGAATINPSTGLLSATAVGTVTVRATANDGSGVFDDAVITIDPILVTNLSIYGQGGVFNVANNATLQMLKSTTPTTATDSSVTWSVTNGTGAATINPSTGLLSATVVGTVTVRATANDGSGVFDDAVITIDPILVTNLSIYGQGGVFNVANNATLQMLKSTTPTTATDSSVTWSVTNGTGAATINPSTGLLSATAVGTVTVRATANDGSGIFDDAVITIDPILVTNLSIYGQGNATTVTSGGGTLQMLKTTTPNTATDSSVTWSVTNGTGTATINSTTGVLTGGTNGTVTVQAVTNDGTNISATEVITVVTNNVPVSSIVVNGQGGVTTISTAGGNLQMVETVLPANATNQTVTWSLTAGAANGTINATTGLLTATNNGSVRVRATATDGSGVFGERVITITNQTILVTSLSIYGQGGVFNVANNATLQMLKTTTPNTATDSSVTWSVTNGTGAATINPSTGLLSATAVGTVTVRATANDGSGVFDDAVITIDPILVTNLSIYGQGGVFNVANNATLQMLKTTTPNTATDSSVTWSVTNGTGAATINPSTGLLSATAVGTVTVRATANDGSGVFDDAVITIDPILVTNLAIYGQGGVFNVANSATLQMLKTTTPNTATDSSVTWSVTNGTGAATINPSTGLLSATAVGTVTVRATANDGSGVFDDAVITIDPILVTSLSIYGQGNATTVTSGGGTLQMLKTTTPNTATDSSVTWSVTNGTGTATINSTTGVLTGGTNGTVTVQAVTNDGTNISATEVITVVTNNVPVSSIVVNGQGGVTTISTAGGNLQMVETVLPANATNQTVTWSLTAGAANGTINATTGLLTATNNGSVRVRATATDGSGVFGERVITITNQTILVTNLTIYGQGGVFNVVNNATLQMLKSTTPTTATDSSVTWSVTNGTGAATINPSTGLLSATAVGTVTVRATANDGSGVFDDAVITIDPILVTSLSIYGQGNATTVTSGGGTLQMLKTTTPNTATDSSVTWSVTNGTGTATINSTTGVLTGGTNGTVTVQAVTNDGTNISATEVITVVTNNVPVSSIVVNGQGGVTTISTAGGNLQMVETVLPANATNQTVTWGLTAGAANGTINTTTGLLTATNNGSVRVRATATDGSGVFGERVITITNQTILVDSIAVRGQGGATTISNNGGSLQMIADVFPINANNRNVTWSVTSGGTGAANIDPSTGVLTAVANGAVIVRATAVDGSGVYGETPIVLTNQTGSFVPVATINVNGQGGATTITTNGGSLQMIANVLPVTASNKNVTWSVIPGTGTASINATTGVLRATTNGTVTVRATAQDGSGVFGQTVITLSNQSPIFITAIQVFGNGGQTTITTNGGQLQMIAIITPNNATNQNLAWTVNDPTIATINANGMLQAVDNGTVLVTATSTDGTGISGSAVITISNQTNVLVNLVQVYSPSGITNINTVAGQLQLDAYILPNNATNQNVTWASSDPTLATVDATGNVTAISNGVVAITATAQDGSGASGSLNIQITNQGVAVITIDGEEVHSTAKVYPNPFVQSFTLELDMQEEANNAQIIVMDVSGRTIHQQQQALAFGNNNISINLSQKLEAGMYFIRIITDNELLVKPIVKQ